jgi:CheY-like chemotaxis protein
VQLSDEEMQAGTGLGLSIVQQFVHLMGGVITIDSTLGKGSLFHLELPLDAAEEAAMVQQADERRSKVVGLAPGQTTYRILIAEDQRDNQLLLSKLMTDIGLEVKVANDGEECIRLFEDWKPDLIWMDRRMPQMDGVEATRRIRQLPGGDQVKIVAVTASVFKEQKDELLEVGMDGFVRKPYLIDEIYQSLEQQLGIELLYQDDQVEKATPSILTPAMLVGLDDSVRSELQEALGILDAKQIAAVIKRIGEQDQALAGSLKRLADNFDYPSIILALEKSVDQGQY